MKVRCHVGIISLFKNWLYTYFLAKQTIKPVKITLFSLFLFFFYANKHTLDEHHFAMWCSSIYLRMWCWLSSATWSLRIFINFLIGSYLIWWPTYPWHAILSLIACHIPEGESLTLWIATGCGEVFLNFTCCDRRGIRCAPARHCNRWHGHINRHKERDLFLSWESGHHPH